MPSFIIGSANPLLIPDKGAGMWKSQEKTTEMQALKVVIMSYIPHASVLVGKDAANHLKHYLNNTGLDYTIDLEGMVNDVKDAKNLFNKEFEDAKHFVSGLGVGKHCFTSARAINGYNQKYQSQNWFYAIGGYSFWSKGRAIIAKGANGKKDCYMKWQFHFYDRYNWDRGKSVTIMGQEITDEYMGRFHREGITREFNCYGSIRRIETWGEVNALDPKLVSRPTANNQSRR